MTQDARQAAEATDYEAKARELAEFVQSIVAAGIEYGANSKNERQSIANMILAAIKSAHAAAQAERPREWRCFHCDETFTDPDAAREHFGLDELKDPACKIAGCGSGLVGYIRQLERQISEYQTECDPISKAWYAREADHAAALVREEQKGFDKAVAEHRAFVEAERAALDALAKGGS